VDKAAVIGTLGKGSRRGDDKTRKNATEMKSRNDWWGVVCEVVARLVGDQ